METVDLGRPATTETKEGDGEAEKAVASCDSDADDNVEETSRKRARVDTQICSNQGTEDAGAEPDLESPQQLTEALETDADGALINTTNGESEPNNNKIDPTAAPSSGQQYRLKYVPRYMPTKTFLVARSEAEMKGHTAFLTFCVRPPLLSPHSSSDGVQEDKDNDAAASTGGNLTSADLSGSSSS
jgi:hypothetical protein